MTRKNQSIFGMLMDAPWWVAVITSAAIYVTLTMAVPYFATDNPMLKIVLGALSTMAPFFAIIILLIAPFSFFNAQRKSKQLDSQRDIDSIRELHWRNFEELVAEAYRRRGYKVTEGSYGADGGIDLELRKENKVVLVQCKQWKTQKIGVSVIREMYGVLIAEKASRFIIIGSGKFTQQAKDFAVDKPIELIDGLTLLDLIKDVQAEPNVKDSDTPECPRCGSALVERHAKRGANIGKTFLGCSAFPKCRYTA